MNEMILYYNGIKHIFFDKQKYLQFKDFLENGIKIVKRKEKVFYFNDGAMLVDTTFCGAGKKYVLTKNNKVYHDNKYIKKYLLLI